MSRCRPSFLQSWGPLLVVIHALSAVVLCGASVHQSGAGDAAAAERAVRGRLLRVYSVTTLLSYLATVTGGALLYPRYRVVIQALFLDQNAPWAANLFDFKENLATLGLPLAVGAAAACDAAFTAMRADFTDTRRCCDGRGPSGGFRCSGGFAAAGLSDVLGDGARHGARGGDQLDRGACLYRGAGA